MANEEATVKEAVEVANVNALRLAVYQQTADPRLADMKVERSPIRGGASYLESLGAADAAVVREVATEYLLRRPEPQEPKFEDLRPLMEMFTGGPLTDDEFAIGVEELAFPGLTPPLSWSSTRAGLPPGFHVVVVGAGISGIAAAIRLDELQIPYTVLERQEDLGGTWHLNQYPDARVDTHGFAYQYKFAQKHRWQNNFPPQGEVLEYLRDIAASRRLRPQIRFGTELREATWDEVEQVWRLALVATDGTQSSMSANVILSCSGLFSTPNIPNIPGLSDFGGSVLHTTGWKPDMGSYAGRRVAILGNGSTGVQLMPRLAEGAAKLVVFQRSPQWMAEVPTYRQLVPEAANYLLDNLPGYWNWLSFATYLGTAHLQDAQIYDEQWQSQGGIISERNDNLRATLTRYVQDKLASRPDLVEKVLPNYAPLGRRLVMDSGWYDALLRPNVELVTSRIDRVTETGIVTADGISHDVDVIVAATGFKTARYLWPVEYVGRNGITTEQVWAPDGARAYLGMVVPGFPNLFIFYGPNGQPRAGAFHSWADVWARYSLRLIVSMLEAGGRSMECRQEVFADYNRRLDEATKRIIWERESGNSYYVNEFGRSSVNMPWRTEEYHAMLRRSDLSDFDVK